jgi:hypothetical protein
MICSKPNSACSLGKNTELAARIACSSRVLLCMLANMIQCGVPRKGNKAPKLVRPPAFELRIGFGNHLRPVFFEHRQPFGKLVRARQIY